MQFEIEDIAENIHKFLPYSTSKANLALSVWPSEPGKTSDLATSLVEILNPNTGKFENRSQPNMGFGPKGGSNDCK
jgi:hypothetical protein